MSLALTPDQPWLGLASYEETHRPYFFGRRAEEDDLFERVRRHRLSVLYGPSGLGKTSLLRAGLMPRLVASGWLPVRVRLTYPERLGTIVEADPQSLLQQVLESLADALVAAEHPAGEKLRAALSAPLASSVTPLPSLWELWHDTSWGLREPGAPRPVLLLDQFEEIFTLGEDEARARAAARVLRDALADLIEDRPPPALDRRLQEDPAFAEHFDFTPDTARVVLVLREDYLSRLERWKKLLPSLLRNRLELRLLDGPRALEAVTGPARAGRAAGDAGLVPDTVAAAIVRAVSDVPEDTPIEDIEAVPPLLSLLCKELNEKRRAASPAAAQIDLALVRENRSAILQRFYEECFDGFPPAVRLVMEDHLLSPGGYRENPGYDTLVSALTARGVSEPAWVLTTLVERRLITVEDRGGRRRVELTHDVLAPIVKRSLDERREREAAEEAQRKLAEESAKALKRRALFAIMAALTVFAATSAGFGWRKAQEARIERDGANDAKSLLDKKIVDIVEAQAREAAALKKATEANRIIKESEDRFKAKLRTSVQLSKEFYEMIREQNQAGQILQKTREDSGWLFDLFQDEHRKGLETKVSAFCANGPLQPEFEKTLAALKESLEVAIAITTPDENDQPASELSRLRQLQILLELQELGHAIENEQYRDAEEQLERIEETLKDHPSLGKRDGIDNVESQLKSFRAAILNAENAPVAQTAKYANWIKLPSRRIRISPHEVSVDEFREFVDETGYQATAINQTIDGAKFDYVKGRINWRNPGFPQAPDHPVVCVSWEDAREYIIWKTRQAKSSGHIGKFEFLRLPWDEEWRDILDSFMQGLPQNAKEFPYSPDNVNIAREEILTSILGSWFLKGYSNPVKGLDAFNHTAPVNFGLQSLSDGSILNLIGNVREWVADPGKSTKQHYARGTGWNDADKSDFSPAFRWEGKVGAGSIFIGFRLVVDESKNR